MNALLLAVSLATSPVYELRHDRTADLAVTGSAALLWLSSETFLKRSLAPATCRWCDRDEAGANTLSRFDASGRTLQWNLSQQKTADTMSNAVGFALLPLAVLGTDAFLAHESGALEGFGTDALIVGESVALALVFNQVVKFWAGRERPFVHVLPAGGKALTEHPSDNNLSFFSGHTTFAFALTSSAATVAELRGYKRAWLVWAIGLPFAIATPYLRLAADKHYLTDVLVGAAVGSAFGVGIPRLFHERLALANVSLKIAPAPGGLGLSGTF